ncbi:MAG: glutamate decarboxylase, partial [Actinomycetia bacterium]|nr:glutamate decarboxylase [Actinomycetes bacterium]
MAVHKRVPEHETSTEIDINPLYFREKSCEIPRFKLPAHGVLPRTALQIVRDELILDGNARLNLATFVTTWMEPEAETLM